MPTELEERRSQPTKEETGPDEGQIDGSRKGPGLLLGALMLLVAGAAVTVAAIQVINGDGSSTPTPAAPATAVAGGKVGVELGEMFIKPASQPIAAGRTTFDVSNAGSVTHEMVVVRTDTPAGQLPTNGAGEASEKGSIGEVADLKAGKSDSLTLNLKAGHYALICNLPGHYAAGMYTDLQVR
jgi:uncharacterized cupredoxin-like copper-binding protein